MNRNKKLSSHTKGTIQHLESFLEVLLLSLVYYFVWRHGYDDSNFPPYMGNGKYVLAGVYAVLSYLFIKNSDGFQFGQLRKADLWVAQCIAILIVNAITYFQLCLIANGMVTLVPMLMLTVLDIVIATISIYVYKGVYQFLDAPYNMVMIYGSRTAVGMKLKMDSRRDKYQVNHLISVDKGLEYICSQLSKYDAVVLNDVPPQIRNDIVKYCYQHSIRLYVVPKITDIILKNAEDISTFDTPMQLVHGQGLTVGQRFAKRTLDIILCLFAMILAAPIMAAVAIAIKLEDGGPAFYKQKRVTVNNREFDVLKFRSMIVDAEKFTGAVLASEDDPRITKVGRFIRATRLDELPQILNILKGDMTWVGPRPERMKFIEEFCQEIPEFAYRTKVKAGLTGYAQIYGKYNTSPYDKLRLDLMYIEHYSIILDIKLILTTVRILFSKESTEGIDIAEQNQQKLDALLDELQDQEFSGAAK